MIFEPTRSLVIKKALAKPFARKYYDKATLNYKELIWVKPKVILI
jgi:hypothetical protein|tara:strand:+ start:464 stop:598 length:135 start_codon:yes stop_codon:yes gene_type:complete